MPIWYTDISCHLNTVSDKPRKQQDAVLTPSGPRRGKPFIRLGREMLSTLTRAGKPGVIRSNAEERTVNVVEDVVITPGGARPRSLVHLIEPDHVLDGSDGRLQTPQLSGSTVTDFGLLHLRPGNTPLMTGNMAHPPALLGKVPALGSGWISNAGRQNSTGNSISSSRTTWMIPSFPATQSGQLIYLFNWIQKATMIYQPVLQWSSNGAFGGNYWVVASWYADGQGGFAFATQTSSLFRSMYVHDWLAADCKKRNT